MNTKCRRVPTKTEGMMAHVHEAPTLTPASDMNSLDQASSGEALQNDITLVKVTIPLTSPHLQFRETQQQHRSGSQLDLNRQTRVHGTKTTESNGRPV
jgi:hypothetical protein